MFNRGEPTDREYGRARLSEVMADPEHVVTVHPDSTVTDGPGGLYAPELDRDAAGEPCIPEPGAACWELLTGHSGQWRYTGAELHPSEITGVRLADHILTTPGHWAWLASPDYYDRCANCGEPIGGDGAMTHDETGDPECADVPGTAEPAPGEWWVLAWAPYRPVDESPVTGYRDCPCCGETYVGADHTLCSECTYWECWAERECARP